METTVVSHLPEVVWAVSPKYRRKFKFCHVSASPTFAVTERIHPLRWTPHKLDSPLDESENGRIPAGFADSTRHPGPVRSSARSVITGGSRPYICATLLNSTL